MATMFLKQIGLRRPWGRCFSSKGGGGGGGSYEYAIAELNKEMESIFGERPSASGLDSAAGVEPQSLSFGSLEGQETLSHIDCSGQAAMVDVSSKEDSKRVAVASCRVLLGPKAFSLVAANQIAKGDVLNVAKIAGISGAKQTSSLIPLCHNIGLTHISVDLTLNEKESSVEIEGEAATTGKTGVDSKASLSSSSSTLQFPSKPKTLTLNPPQMPNRRLTPLAIDLTAGTPGGDAPKKFEIDGAFDHARDLFEKLPRSVKSFPWAKTLENFLKIVSDLAAAVGKYLAVPVLALTQLSEMSYCAHERKLVLVPIPFLVGFAVAGVMKDTTVELSSEIKEGGFPWHLLLIAIFFALLKLPGPYYPYWGRLLIPHFANGGLWRSVWLVFIWYKGSQSSSLGDHNQPAH